ncbi:hypothetical protein LJC58_10145, partial [Lachnospiraceae bacterium OttesenSCG-928-D06]|nr:hypothetical protein [Lachnospiraceae bacterium OttesenSCG-928-D06]
MQKRLAKNTYSPNVLEEKDVENIKNYRFIRGLEKSLMEGKDIIMKKQWCVYSIAIIIIVILLMFICGLKIKRRDKDSQEVDKSEIMVEIIEGENGMAEIGGWDKSSSLFRIKLDYLLDDVKLNKFFFIDLTGDNKEELCLEMNIRNSISPDLTTILIYDVESENVLFPSLGESFIFNANIGQLKEDIKKNVIIYSNYTKINGVTIEDENSIIAWDGREFVHLEYQNKLLLETDEYLIFYKKLLSQGKSLNKLVVLDTNTLETIQEIELIMNEENIVKKIS